MAEAQESERADVTKLPPLASAIQTFIGRDENGPFFSRLEYLDTHTQNAFVPKIIGGLLFRLVSTEREYMVRFEAELARTLGEHDQIEDALDFLHRPNHTYREKWLGATAYFQEFTSTNVMPRLVFHTTGKLPQTRKDELAGLAREHYPDDPLIHAAREASRFLKDSDLDHMGDATLYGSVLLVHTLFGTIEADEPKTTQATGPDAA